MDIKELLKLSPKEIIAYLKQKTIKVKSWDEIKNDYYKELHAITKDNETRKVKTRSDGTLEKPAIIPIGLEALLAKRVNEFTFAIPVAREYKNTDDNETRKKIADAIEKIYEKARIDTVNLERGLSYYAACEIFTLWYAVEDPNTYYGFNSKYKLRCKTFTPKDGVSLYPFFDEYGDMVAMSYQYESKILDEDYTFFEAYTKDRHMKYKAKSGSTEWEEESNEPIIIIKIPGAYAHREVPVFDGLSVYRDRMEYAISQDSDIISYNSAPILKVSGGIKGSESKGESRRVWRVENGGDVSYVSWNQSTESFKNFMDMLLKLFFMEAQMPDISFDNMRSLGNIGYDARMTLLMDAHLKIGDEKGVWLEFLDRECNVIKAFLKKMNVEWEDEVDNVVVTHSITPFVLNDEDAYMNRLMKMNGGKALVSQKDSIRMSGYSSDPEKTINEINNEERERASINNPMADLFSAQ